MTNSDNEAVREAVGIFQSAKAMETAIEDLEENGFDRAEISLLASQDTVNEKLGHIYSDVRDLEDDPATPRTAFISTESVGGAEGALIGGLIYVGALAAAGVTVASGGAFGALIAAAAAGGTSGGLIGGVLAGLVGKHHADYLQDQLADGGLLVWVRTRDQDHENRAIDVLKRNGAIDVHVHSIAA